MTRVLAMLSLLVLGGCDDTVFATRGLGYEPTWLGMQVFMNDHCVECHPSVTDPDWPEDLEADVLDGTELYVVPGIPEESLLWRIVSEEARREGDPPLMPLGRRLTPPEVEHVRVWIEDGAPL